MQLEKFLSDRPCFFLPLIICGSYNGRLSCMIAPGMLVHISLFHVTVIVKKKKILPWSLREDVGFLLICYSPVSVVTNMAVAATILHDCGYEAFLTKGMSF